MTKLGYFGALLATVLASACSNTTTYPGTLRSSLPGGVDGYQCYRRENFGPITVEATAHPDYRGGYEYLSANWKVDEYSDGFDPVIHLAWTQGEWIPSPGFLSVNWVLPTFPPLGTQISLRLSSGEFIQNDFIHPNLWRQWAPGGDGGYGGNAHTNDRTFMEAFERAEWAEVIIFGPDGATLAYERIELSQLPQQLETMRRLEREVIAATSNYEQDCSPIEFEYY